ncbi:MAG: citrate/2-methylcitrate synthase [Pseudomonadota bacterium]
MNAPLEIDPGLEGVIVGRTAVSEVDGNNGRLRYRGTDVETLVEHPFAEVAALVLLGRPGIGLTDIAGYIDAVPSLSSADTERVLALPRSLHPMQLLQSLVPVLEPAAALPSIRAEHLEAIAGGRPLPEGIETELARGIGIATRLPLLVATHFAGRRITSASEGYCTNFLEAIGAPPQPELRHAFEVMQILQLEHSFNASSFTARVIASTQAPIDNAIAGAIGALHGRLHGGADQAALETADTVGTPDAAAAFVDECLRSGRKVMGMGHREYKVLDPRARFARDLARQVARGTEHERTFETLAAIEARFEERMAERGKALHANIEFYKGVIFRALGLPPQYFTALFAMARCFGYIAHVLEARFDNRLIRPAVVYQPLEPGSR